MVFVMKGRKLIVEKTMWELVGFGCYVMGFDHGVTNHYGRALRALHISGVGDNTTVS